MEINLHLKEDLRNKNIGEKVLLDTLEVIDKLGDTLVCLDSGIPDCYDINTDYCLSNNMKINIKSFKSRYILDEVNDYSAQFFEHNLNKVCHSRVRELSIYDGIRILLPKCISKDFRFSIDRDNYTLDVTIPNNPNSLLMEGHQTEDFEFPPYPLDSTRLLLFRKSLKESCLNLDIEISDVFSQI